MPPAVPALPTRLERFTKLIVLASVFLALSADTWSASLVWHEASIAVPAAFVAMWIAGRIKPLLATSLTLFVCYLVPAAFIILRGEFVTAEWSVWLAAVCGLILATTPPWRWSLPTVWRLPLVFWALVVALTWPIVAFREANFHAPWTDPTMLVWVATAALICMIGVLWFDSLCCEDAQRQVDVERRVMLPLGSGWAVAGCVGVYQMLGHISFLNSGFWSVLGRATGTLNEANTFGVVSAMWGGVLLAMAFDSEDRRHRIAGVAALLLSWAAIWASGSRSSLLVAAFTLAAIVFEACRRYGARRAVKGFAVLAPIGALIAVAIVVLARGSAIGPGARFVRDFAPRASWSWVQQMAMNLWNRGEYGPVSLLMIRRFPFAGVGTGGFHYAWASFSWWVFHVSVPADNAQNWYRHELAELGVVGSLGWIVWTLSLGWMLVTAEAVPSRQLTSTAIRGALIGFGLISLLGVPGQEIAVAFTLWTMAFAFLRTIKASPGVSSRRIGTATWALVLALVAGYTAVTVVEARTTLRPPVRAVMADMDYWLGFYNTEGVLDGAQFRWAKQNALAVVSTPDRWLELSVWVDHPDIATNPVDARVWRDGKRVMQIHLTTNRRETIYLRVPPDEKRMILETWVSRVEYSRDRGSRDNRELGLLVRWNPVYAPPAGAIVVE